MVNFSLLRHVHVHVCMYAHVQSNFDKFHYLLTGWNVEVFRETCCNEFEYVYPVPL